MKTPKCLMHPHKYVPTTLHFLPRLKMTPAEPGMFDETLNVLNGYVARMLNGLPEMTSVDLSMEQVKAKGQ